jgi:hypothetical protein
MPAKIKDLAGIRFGRLTVLKMIGQLDTRAVWRCRCDCGGIAIVRGAYLTTNRTKSCGCLRREVGLKNLANAD